jgi:hypothetical protein
VNLNPITLTCLAGWLVLLLPTLFYLFVTWTIRRKLLLERFTTTNDANQDEDEPIRKYYAQFFPGRKLEPDLYKQFKRDFDRSYGRRYYLLAFILLAIVSAIGLWITAVSIQGWVGWLSVRKPVPPIVISAFLGAYAWVLYDQFARFRTGDFTPYDVYAGVYRFLIAVPLGVSLGAFAKDNVGVGIAFLLAAFPTTTLFRLSRRLVGTQLSLGEGTENGNLELEKLQCMGRSNAERFLDEGVATIAELAWSNPIDLAIRTNRDLNFVIDSISQALLWIYFRDVEKLYPFSIRGAQEACTLLEDCKSPRRKVQKAAAHTLKVAAAAINLDEQAFTYTLMTVAEDPYAEFLYSIWR